ncbi:MAG: element excision factor XisH family protein [Caldilineaceae bacterium]
MPKPDIYYDHVRQALIKDGWTITHHSYTLRIGKKRLFADLGAARLISAERGFQKIAVEIKSFVSPSDVYDLEQMLGQYVLYRRLIARREPDRMLYVAVTQNTFEAVFQTELGEVLLVDEEVHLFVFDENKKEILQWLPPIITAI